MTAVGLPTQSRRTMKAEMVKSPSFHADALFYASFAQPHSGTRVAIPRLRLQSIESTAKGGRLVN
jgi:hypothetical protein